MSDIRRRRKSPRSGESDGYSDSNEELDATRESKDSGSIHEQLDSEYDTAGSVTETESEDGGQRESGDGQEEKPPKKLDDDEDRRNPQYIPKRGTFYEHDDRTAEEVTDTTTEVPNEREVKDKKVWKDKEDRWNHDRYDDQEQAPKSHAELIAVYGYDIRNEEGPPRARRRRRYGRGPNKYTRNWEDEDAYGKVLNIPTTQKVTRKPNNGEDFPALRGSEQNDSTMKNTPVISSAWYSNKTKTSPKAQNFPSLQPEGNNAVSKQNVNSQTNENQVPNREPNNPAWKREAKNTNSFENVKEDNVKAGGDPGRVVVKTSPRDNKKYSKDPVVPPVGRSRGRGFQPNNMNTTVYGNGTLESKPKGRGNGLINMDNRQNVIQQNQQEQLVNEMKHMNISPQGKSYHQAGRPGGKHFYSPTSNQHDMNWAPPRIQQTHLQQQPAQQAPQPQQSPSAEASGNRPKRYSSLRQKPTIGQNPGQQTYQAQHTQHTYYPPPPPQVGYPANRLDQSSPVVTPPTAPLTGQPLMPMPPGAAPTGYAPPTFLVPTPQFIPTQTAPNIINYVQGPNGPIFQPNFQSYNPSGVPPPGPPPPQELYQPQGCTYYSPAQQQNPQQQLPPLRRPKAAIPILPPPDSLPNHPIPVGRGRSLSSTADVNDRPRNNVDQEETEDKKQSTNSETIESESGQFDDAPIDSVVPETMSTEALDEMPEVKTEVQVTIAVTVNEEASLPPEVNSEKLAIVDSVETEMNDIVVPNADQLTVQSQEVQEAGA